MELNIREQLGRFWSNSKRVFVIAKKPDWKEFQNMSLVTGIGIIVIAIIAYIVYLVFALVGLA
jgi:protein transport protein SEC61 subunit gamma-like protein